MKNPITCLFRIFGNTAYVEKKIIPSLKLNEWKTNKCTIMADRHAYTKVARG